MERRRPSQENSPPTKETERIPENFWGKIERLQERGRHVSVGLDSDWRQIPAEYKNLGIEEGTFRFNKEIIDNTHDLVCTYKPNLAFYEDTEEGERALSRTVDYIHETYPEIPVIGDAKVGDIGSTNDGYVRKYFGRYGFDAITVNPYMGGEALKPFLTQKDKGIIAICKTSNPGSGEIQDKMVEIDEFTNDIDEKIQLMRLTSGTKIPLYMGVANRLSNWNKEYGNVAAVVGATYPDQAEQIRGIDGRMQFLVPGVGEQGADVQKAVAASMDVNNSGIIVNSSRGVIFAKRERTGPGGQMETAGQAARRKTMELDSEINYFRENPEGFTIAQQELANDMLELGVIKFGAFKLKLHETKPDAPLSPFYFDQRVLRSAPKEVVLNAALVLQELTSGLKFDAYADTPTAITPLVSVLSHINGLPMITPRGEKTHGSGAKIDGIYTPGETTAVDFDDVITSGISAIDSILKLRAAGVTVTDFVALLNREQGGIKAIEQEGVKVHYAYDISNLLRYYKRTGQMTQGQYDICINYLKTNR